MLMVFDKNGGCAGLHQRRSGPSPHRSDFLLLQTLLAAGAGASGGQFRKTPMRVFTGK